MPVDKFGESHGNVVAGTAVQFSTAGLVHKTGDTMAGILSMGGFQMMNVGAPKAITDAATKGYADTIDQDNLQLSGGVMTDDLFLTTGTDAVRVLGCTDLSSGKGFSLVLGSFFNQLQFAAIAPPHIQTPITMETHTDF